MNQGPAIDLLVILDLDLYICVYICIYMDREMRVVFVAPIYIYILRRGK